MSTLQQVNLIGKKPDRAGQPFSFLTMLVAWGVIIVFFASLQLWGVYQTKQEREQITILDAQQNKVLQQLVALRASAPLNRKAQLDNKIANIQSEVERRSRILRTMNERNIGNENGFSSYLVGLSRQHMEGISLDHFGLLEGGTYIELSGWTHRAELAPGYVKRLRNESSFSDSRFGDMTIERVKDKRADALQFKFGEAEKDG